MKIGPLRIPGVVLLIVLALVAYFVFIKPRAATGKLF